MELSPDLVAELSELYAIRPETIAHYNEAQLRLLAQGLLNERPALPHLRLVTVDGERVD